MLIHKPIMDGYIVYVYTKCLGYYSITSLQLYMTVNKQFFIESNSNKFTKPHIFTKILNKHNTKRKSTFKND